MSASSDAGESVPSYDELLQQTDAPAGSSWRVFGAGDQLGTLNFLTPERTAHAASLVRHGRSINLDYPINTFEPFPSGTRHSAVHRTFANNVFHRDDYLDGFYLQSSSQIDSLRHIGHPVHGFYGGLSSYEITGDSEALGIHAFAQRGIAGRGVLLDVQRFRAARGRPLRPDHTDRISVADLEATAGAQGVELRYGDVLLVRTGWAGYYTGLSQQERVEYNSRRATPGLEQRREMVSWLWDHRIAMVASDNTGVEASPAIESDFVLPDQPVPERGPDHNGMLHRPLIPLLGMAIGELWALDELADDCAADGVFEFLLVAKPLNLIGGAGSPANATALK